MLLAPFAAACWLALRGRLPRWGAWAAALALAFSLGYGWAAVRAHWRLAEELPVAWEGVPVRVEGVVAGLPEVTATRMLTPAAIVPQHLSLTWFRDRNEQPAPDAARIGPVHAGERWQLAARLKRPHGTANPHAPEFEYWALEQGIRATGAIYPEDESHRLAEQVMRPDYFVNRLRERIRARILDALPASPGAGILVALVVGDQSRISTAQWSIFWNTGVGHLISISGLHITMLGGLVGALFAWGWRRTRFALQVPTRKAAIVAGAIAALFYALLAGMSIPTQRTLLMLAVAALALWFDRPVTTSRVLALALLGVVLLDPWAVLAAGFWLSFGAVALMTFAALQVGRAGGVSAALRTQAAVTIGLAPILVGFFHQLSLVSPLANAVAIPAVSLVIVPLALVGSASPGNALLRLADWLLDWCMRLLGWLAALPHATWDVAAPGLLAMLFALGGALWLLAPRGWPARWLGVLGCLPLFAAVPPRPPAGALWLDVLDVGQGTAALVRTARHTLLYDTGPGWGDADSGMRVIVPFLRGEGVRRLDGIVVSHADGDHSGGALSVIAAIPATWLLSSLPQSSPIVARAAQAQRCVTGQSWIFDGVRFEVVHPRASAYDEANRKVNDLSCVVRVSSAFGSILLTGDAEARSEIEMLEGGAERLRSTVLLVPHHGSRTSSSADFVAAVAPAEAIYTVGYRNRFGHPRAQAIQAYRSVGAGMWRSDLDGAVSVRLDAQGIVTGAYRRAAPRYWRDAVPPLDGGDRP